MEWMLVPWKGVTTRSSTSVSKTSTVGSGQVRIQGYSTPDAIKERLLAPRKWIFALLSDKKDWFPRIEQSKEEEKEWKVCCGEVLDVN